MLALAVAALPVQVLADPSGTSARRQGSAQPFATALVADAGPLTQTSAERLRWNVGLWAVSPLGVVEPLVDRSWRPLAYSAAGFVAAVRRGEPRGRYAYHVVEVGPAGGSAVALAPRTKSLPCVAWRADGEKIAYLTGETLPFDTLDNGAARAPAYATRGRLWVASASDPESREVIARGLFPECPVWSAAGGSLYFYRRVEESPRVWSLLRYTPEETARVTDFRARATTLSILALVSNRTTGVAPAGDRIVFVRGKSLYEFADGRVRLWSRSGALRKVERFSERRGYGTRMRVLRLSPDGRFVAFGVDGATGVFGPRGRLRRMVPGALRGWSGNEGVLSVNRRITLVMHPRDVDEAPVRIKTRFKQPVVSEPAGAWFAYAETHGEDLVVFHRAGGSLWSEVDAGFRPALVEALAEDGRTSDSPWP